MRYPRKFNACWRLFNYKYDVYVPQYLMYSAEYIKKVGVVSSGDAVLDKERMYDTVLVRQTAVGMAVLNDQGAGITARSITEPIDAIPSIYRDIQEHLIDWEKAIINHMHVDDIPPISDFRQLEELARELYRFATHVQPIDTREDRSIQAALLSFNQRRVGGNLIEEARGKLYDREGRFPPYTSIVDRIERLIVGGQVYGYR